jgi:hypothetical protein
VLAAVGSAFTRESDVDDEEEEDDDEDDDVALISFVTDREGGEEDESVVLGSLAGPASASRSLMESSVAVFADDVEEILVSALVPVLVMLLQVLLLLLVLVVVLVLLLADLSFGSTGPRRRRAGDGDGVATATATSGALSVIGVSSAAVAPVLMSLAPTPDALPIGMLGVVPVATVSSVDVTGILLCKLLTTEVSVGIGVDADTVLDPRLDDRLGKVEMLPSVGLLLISLVRLGMLSSSSSSREMIAGERGRGLRRNVSCLTLIAGVI